MTFRIKPLKTALFFGMIAVLLVLVSSVGYLLKFVVKYPNIHNFSLFNLDWEGNVPTYFSSLILLLSSFLLGVIALYKKKEKDSYVLHWAFLSVLFMYLSLDEAVAIHEILNRPLREMYDLGGIFYHASVIPWMILAMIFVAGYFRFWISLRSRSKFFFGVAAAFYTGGAIGLELIGGRYAYLYGTNDLSYGLLTTLEEALEMLGIVFFIYALLDYMRSCFQVVQFDLE